MKQLELLVLKLKSRLSVDDSERRFAAYRGRALIIIDPGGVANYFIKLDGSVSK